MALVKCCIGRGIAAFSYKENKDYYTYTYFKIRSFMNEIKQFNDEGTVFGSIGKSDFEALDITVPPRSLIKNFEQTTKPINDKVIENCKQIRTLEKFRDTLLPKLMSGEVRCVETAETRVKI
jgi:type I restriction enzyme S subunit